MAEILLFLSIIMIAGFGFAFVARRPFDAVFFFLCLFCYRHVPSIFYLFGFDGGGDFFASARQSGAMIEMALIMLSFMVFTYAGFFLFRKTHITTGIFPDYRYDKSALLLILGILALSLFGFYVAWAPIQQAGGNIFKAIYLVRNLDFYEGLSFLKKFSQFGAFLSAAYLVDLLLRKKRRTDNAVPWRYIAFIGGLFIFNMGCSFIMGGKGFIIYPLAFTAITYAVCAHQKPLRALLLPVIALIGLIFVLQFVRITLVKESSVDDPVSYIYGALHFDVMDSNIVFIDTLGVYHQESFGESFIHGIAGVVPRAIWPDKPTQITVGGAFKESLSPNSNGGWPVFAYNQWYASFGWAGLIFGGLLTGMILASIQAKCGQYRDNPYCVYLSLIFVLYALSPTGIKNEFFMNYIFFVVPLFIFKALTLKKWERWLFPQAVLSR